MFRRSRAPAFPVTIHLDGAALPAERGEAPAGAVLPGGKTHLPPPTPRGGAAPRAGGGEPLAAALLAADKTILARSPKLHRPRGPSCFRGGCDGCLARVDGVPHVMTCLFPPSGGERIDSQNVVGSRKADLLRVTDWFFAKGLDHHHLMAGVPGLSDVMTSV